MSKRPTHTHPTEVKAVAADQNPAVPKKAKAEIDLALQTSPDELFEARANYYAVHHLLENKRIQEDAVKLGAKLFEAEIKKSLRQSLMDREYAAIQADPARKVAFEKSVEDRAVNKLLTDHRHELYERAQIQFQKDETDRMLTHHREGFFRLGVDKPIPNDVAAQIKRSVENITKI